MSYVIQNFSQFNKLVTITPRLKFLVILKNLNKLFMFFKVSIFLLNTDRFYATPLSYLLLFYKHFYSNQLVRIFNTVNLSLVGNYTNNLKKSIVFFNFKNLHSFLADQKINKLQIKLADNFLENTYFLSTKVANFVVNKKFYRNVFFYLLITLPNVWHTYTPLLKFYLNFVHVYYSTYIFKFYNGHFFKVYNF